LGGPPFTKIDIHLGQKVVFLFLLGRKRKISFEPVTLSAFRSHFNTAIWLATQRELVQPEDWPVAQPAPRSGKLIFRIDADALGSPCYVIEGKRLRECRRNAIR